MTPYGTKGLDVEGDEISLKESLKKKKEQLFINLSLNIHWNFPQPKMFF